jgi:hypothetical protein
MRRGEAVGERRAEIEEDVIMNPGNETALRLERMAEAHDAFVTFGLLFGRKAGFSGARGQIGLRGIA